MINYVSTEARTTGLMIPSDNDFPPKRYQPRVVKKIQTSDYFDFFPYAKYKYKNCTYHTFENVDIREDKIKGSSLLIYDIKPDQVI